MPIDFLNSTLANAVWLLTPEMILAGFACLITRFNLRLSSQLPTAIVFFAAVILFGIATTPFANRHSSQFVFTWPLSLIAMQQIALVLAVRPKTPQQTKSGDWPSLAGAGLLILACLLYFRFTRQLKLAPAWYFLVMLPAAWPLGVPAARRFARSSMLQNILWIFAVFSLYFWAAGGVMLLRTHFFDRTMRDQSRASASISEFTIRSATRARQTTPAPAAARE